MSIPVISNLPPAPQRTDAPATFAAKSDSFVAAMQSYGQSFNAFGSWTMANIAVMNANVNHSNALRNQTQDFRNQAMAYRNEAATFVGNAATSSHFKGVWSSLSGSLSLPASVFHNGTYWTLMYNITNVAAHTPSVSTAWQQSIPTAALDLALFQSYNSL